MRRRIVTAGQRPEFWLGLLLTWTLLSALRSWHTPWALAAGTEALRWGGGIVLALALGLGLRRLQLATQVLTVLLTALVLTTLASGLGPSGHVTGPFRDHQLCASALLVLLPFSVALALAAEAPAWRWGAQIVSVAAAVCLMLTQTRSAWIGAGVATLIFAACWLRHSPSHSLSRSSRRSWVVPSLLAIALAGSFPLLTGTTELGGSLAARAGTLQAIGVDQSWQGRVETWRGALRMLPAHPLAGWGLGRYPGAQWGWTHQGRPLDPAQRPSLSEQAHDAYLQTAIETGAVGMALYLGVLGTLLVRCRRGLRQSGPRRRGLSQAVRIATLALLAGQGVDALASPSYQFSEVSLLFWAGLGLGLAAVNRGAGPEAVPALPPAVLRPLRACAAGAAAIFLSAQVLPLGLLSPVEAYITPANWTYQKQVRISPTSAVVMANSTQAYTVEALYQTPSGQQWVNVTKATGPAIIFGVNGSRGTGVTSKFSGQSPGTLLAAPNDVGRTDLVVTAIFQPSFGTTPVTASTPVTIVN